MKSIAMVILSLSLFLAVHSLARSLCAYHEGVWQTLERWSAECDKREQLELKLNKIHRATRRRVQVVEQLADGKLTLLEAAARFRAINRELGKNFCHVLPGDSLEEQVCRQVINYYHGHLRLSDPERARNGTVRLEAELEAMLNDDGMPMLSCD